MRVGEIAVGRSGVLIAIFKTVAPPANVAGCLNTSSFRSGSACFASASL